MKLGISVPSNEEGFGFHYAQFKSIFSVFLLVITKM